ncbi:MAG: methyltransferase domain-containing protein, partial [Candidatus Binatia bacterium]
DRELWIVRRLARELRGNRPGCHFVVADAARLPFRAEVFDHIAVLDVLEHVPEEERAAREIETALAPGGSVSFFGPAAHWRFPYHRWMRPLALPESQVLDLWGHRRRGYSPKDLELLFPHCDGEGFVAYQEAEEGWRIDVEHSRLPFPLKIVFWWLGERYYRLMRSRQSTCDRLSFGVRLRKRGDGVTRHVAAAAGGERA